MTALQEEFDSEVVINDNPYLTHYNLGRRDVVKYLEMMVLRGVQDE